MKQYFELRDGNGISYGVIENIPEHITLKDVKERVEVMDGFNETLVITRKEIIHPDIVMDWLALDCEQGLDEDFLKVSEWMDIADLRNLTTEVVYTALKMMKDNAELTITEAIEGSAHFHLD